MVTAAATVAVAVMVVATLHLLHWEASGSSCPVPSYRKKWPPSVRITMKRRCFFPATTNISKRRHVTVF
uniref:Putative secreted protein n=1 Tax=Anopheles darlingi TaxID=43151 RepID=A0A2M4DGW2_ANODA